MRSQVVANLLLFGGVGIANPVAGAAAAPDIIFASDFVSGSALQWVRRNPQAGGATIALAPALVSAVKLSNGGANTTLYLQVAPALNVEANYPALSALKTFGPSNALPPAIGDCVIAQGTIDLFHGATELSSATVIASPSIDCGNSPLTPYSTTVANIASDTDPSTTSSFESGPSAEALESVLVTLNASVVGTPVPPGQYKIVDPGGVFNPPYLFVNATLYSSAPPTAAHVQITGVYDEFDTAVPPNQLFPRSASDIVVLP